jgi:methionyl-tRNA formyltransferase
MESDMRVLFLASGGIAIPSLRWLANSRHDIVAVATQPDRPRGRGRRPTPTPVKVHAVELGLEPIQAENVNDPSVANRLLSSPPDVAVTMAFSQKIGQAFIEAIPGGCLNVHPSLLPKYRGAAPVNWAIIRGETKTGVSVFRLVDRIDAGPILSVRETLIKPCETAGELSARLGGVACDALSAALEEFGPDGPPPGRPQDDSQAVPAPKLAKDTGQIRLQQPAEQTVRWINGLFPWPGVQVMYVPRTGHKPTAVRLARASLPDDRPHPPTVPPGTILEDGSVTCVDGAIRILEIQPAGSRLMSWQDFTNGRHVQPGDRFEPVPGA